MGQVAAFVNEHKRDFENMTKVNAIQSMFVGKFDVCYPLPNSLQTFSLMMMILMMNFVIEPCTTKSTICNGRQHDHVAEKEEGYHLSI